MKRALAILGVFFLLLRPVCDVLAVGPEHGEQASHAHVQVSAGQGAASGQSDEPLCCTKLDNGALVQLSGVAEVRAAGEGTLAIATVWSPARDSDVQSDANSRYPPGIVPVSRSFYSRSARIRR